jgi:hypothetical protein
MLFKKKRKIESLGEMVAPKHEEYEEDFEEIEKKVEDVDIWREKPKADVDDRVLRKLEKLSLTILIGAKDEELKEKALALFGKVKLIRSVKGTENENIIKLIAGTEVPEEFIEMLREKGLLDVVYRLSADIKAKDKEELTKMLEEYLKEEYELKEDIKEAFSGKPFKVEEEQAEVAGKLYELGIFEIYIVPKGWFEIPQINGIDVKKALEEFKELAKSLPPHMSKFLEI